MTLDKLKYGAINNKKIIMFLIVLGIIGILSGSLFLTIISKSDQELVKSYIGTFMQNIMDHKIIYQDTLRNSFINNLGYVLIIWLLGISVIGLPIIIFVYFSKIFVIGFSVGSFILTYHLKGILYALVYIFPIHIMNIFVYLLLTLYGIKMSNNLIYSIFKKKEVNVKKILNKYLLILAICLGAMVIYSLYETFIIPFLFEKLKFLVK